MGVCLAGAAVPPGELSGLAPQLGGPLASYNVGHSGGALLVSCGGAFIADLYPVLSLDARDRAIPACFPNPSPLLADRFPSFALMPRGI